MTPTLLICCFPVIVSLCTNKKVMVTPQGMTVEQEPTGALCCYEESRTCRTLGLHLKLSDSGPSIDQHQAGVLTVYVSLDAASRMLCEGKLGDCICLPAARAHEIEQRDEID